MSAVNVKSPLPGWGVWGRAGWGGLELWRFKVCSKFNHADWIHPVAFGLCIFFLFYNWTLKMFNYFLIKMFHQGRRLFYTCMTNHYHKWNVADTSCQYIRKDHTFFTKPPQHWLVPWVQDIFKVQGAVVVMGLWWWVMGSAYRRQGTGKRQVRSPLQPPPPTVDGWY